MKVYALVFEEDDSFDVGSHEEVHELFADREAAERVVDGLIGKSRRQQFNGVASRFTWLPSDVSVQEMKVRR